MTPSSSLSARSLAGWLTRLRRAPAPPVIDVWYGSRQVFGAPGLPQRWVNVLGSVSDPAALAELRYALNGGEDVPLRMGPDRRRLAFAGDFNIELDIDALREGDNQVLIHAVNQRGLSNTTEVTLIFHRNLWPLPYAIDWASVTLLQEVAQVLDGRWAFDARGARPLKPAYDRTLAIGDMNWTDYEVSVDVTLHGIDQSGYGVKESGGAGFGVVIHWLGQSDDPVKGEWPAQPHLGWLPLGASKWYSFKRDGIRTLAIEAEPPPGQTRITTCRLEFGHTYTFKTRAETTPAGNLYRFKVWQPGVEAEPLDWTLERLAERGENGNLRRGSFLLVLHHVDATFGRLSVKPLG